MATNIPPHNLGEVIDATCAYVDNTDITDEELLEIVPNGTGGWRERSTKVALAE